jgi:hypothetical protein
MDTFTPSLRTVDQLNTEKLTRIQATVELMSAKIFIHHNKALDCWTAIVSGLSAKLEYIIVF